jgi:hypothetical protein
MPSEFIIVIIAFVSVMFLLWCLRGFRAEREHERRRCAALVSVEQPGQRCATDEEKVISLRGDDSRKSPAEHSA